MNMKKLEFKKTLVWCICVVCLLSVIIGVTSNVWRYKKNLYDNWMTPTIDWYYKRILSPCNEYAQGTSSQADNKAVYYVLETPIATIEIFLRHVLKYRSFSNAAQEWMKGKTAEQIVKRFGYYDRGRSMAGDYIYDGSDTESELSYIIYTLSPGSLLKAYFRNNYEYEYDLLLKIDFTEDGVAENVSVYRDIPRM